MNRSHRGQGGPPVCQVPRGNQVRAVLFFNTGCVLKGIKAGTLNVFSHRNNASALFHNTWLIHEGVLG